MSADYHLITGAIMEKITNELKKEYPENAFPYFVDNSPVPEVRAAVNAGLGALGRNALFINKKYGSWVFLGEIVTDKFFEPAKTEGDVCDGCEKCVAACPAGAIGENGVTPEKCLSYLSQKKGELSDEVAEKMAENDCAWGCDVCQKVCPMNKNAAVTPIEAFFETARPFVTSSDSIEGRAFAWRGQKVIERNLAAVNDIKRSENK
ncbi:MAG: 4Fe-4S dicluster domain-containing protein [Clostridia bacterium]|nr:4Fe-4S dicluster domain-containing protein [Clostridia bacterium]